MINEMAGGREAESSVLTKTPVKILNDLLSGHINKWKVRFLSALVIFISEVNQRI